MTPTLRIHLLGEFRLFADGQPIDTPHQPRLQALLAYLALHHHAPQPRQQIAFSLWPDSTERQAFVNLRGLLFDLRRALPHVEHFLKIDTFSLGWRSDAAFTSDVAEVEQALQHLEQHDTPDAPTVERVLALYRGEVFPACYEEWLLPIRRALHERVVNTLTKALAGLVIQHEYQTGLHTAEYLLRLDPLHEAAYRHLMHLRTLCGDRTGALRIYYECVTILEQELAVSPAIETQTLYQQLLRGEAQTWPVSTPLPAPFQRHEHVPLVGRKQEWQLLQQAWQQMSSRGPHLITIWGEAGVGKTRLAEELQRWASLQPGTVVYARAYMGEGNLAFAPVTTWLLSDEVQAGLTMLDELWLTELVRLLPELQCQFPTLSSPAPLTEGWQRQHFYEAIARALLMAPAPRLFILDDLQWCDAETLNWLRFLLRFDQETRLLVVGTVRSEAMDEQHPLQTLRQQLLRERQWSEIELSPLSIEETAVLAGHLTNKDVTQWASRIYRETEGNPLFVVEMAHAGLLAGDSLEQDGQIVMLPPTLQAVIEARLAQLTLPARQLAQVAATIGHTFSAEVLAAASGLDEDALVVGLDELWQRRIVRERGSGYDFSHDKIREVVYGQQSQMRRRLLHRRVVAALTQLYVGKLESVAGELAEHAEQAGQLADAVAYHRLAAEVAQRVGAHAEVIMRLRKAIALLQSLSMPQQAAMREELAMCVPLGACLVALRGYGDTEVEATYKRAHQLCMQLGDDPNLMPTLVGLGLFYMIRGEVRQALEIGWQSMQVAQHAQDDGLLLEAHLVIGPALQYLGQLSASVTHLEQIITLYDPARHANHVTIYGHEPGITARVILAKSFCFMGYLDRGLAFMQEGLALAQQGTHYYTLNLAQVYAASMHYLRQEPEEALAVATAGAELARQHGFQYWLVICTMFECWATAHLAAVKGEPSPQTKETLAQMKEAFIAFRRTGAGLLAAHYLGVVAEAQKAAQDLEASWTTLNEALEIARSADDQWNLPNLYRLRGDLLLAGAGSPQCPSSVGAEPVGADVVEAEAESAYLRAIEIAQQQEARFLEIRAATALAKLWVRQGQRERAYGLLKPLVACFTEGRNTPALQNAAALLVALDAPS